MNFETKRYVEPSVRAARRAAEQSAIDAHLSTRGVTRCPTVFVAPSPQATRDYISVPVEPEEILTLSDAADWLSANGRPNIVKLPNGGYAISGTQRLYTREGIIDHVAALKAKANGGADDIAVAAVFNMLSDAAGKGERCPPYDEIRLWLRETRGLRIFINGGVEMIFEKLRRSGRISTMRVHGNHQVVMILDGPNAGKSTAGPKGVRHERDR